MVIWNIILKCSFLFFFVREVHRSWSPLPFPHESGWVFTLPPCEWFGVCPAPMRVVGCLPCPHASGCVFTLSPCEWLGVYLAPMRVVGCLPCPHASGWVFTLPPCKWLGVYSAPMRVVGYLVCRKVESLNDFTYNFPFSALFFVSVLYFI